MSSEKHNQFIMMACREDQTNSFFAAQALVNKMLADNGIQPDDEEEQSPILQVVGNVAVIEIKGKLTSSDSWYNSYCGLLSYNEVRRAFSQAYTNPDVQYILEDYDTPGGLVNGMQETADFMAQVGKVKPRTAFVGAQACSAGYFLAMGADEIIMTPMAEAGSIGVVMVATEYSEMMKENGITNKVIRSGNLKMVGNPYEKLSAASEEYFTEQVAYTAGIFFDNLSQQRQMTSEAMAQNNITSGRTFIGKQAVAAGLADDIDTFDNILATLQKKVDNNQQGFNNGNNSLTTLTANGGEMKKVMLSAEEVARLASGASGTPDPELLKAAAEEKARLEKEAADAAAKKAADEAALLAAGGTGAAPEAGSMSAIDLLKEQLSASAVTIKDLEKKLVLAEAAGVSAETRIAEALACADSLKGIAASAINNMQVALGGSGEDLSALSATEIAAKHVVVSGTFTKAFPVGGVSGSVAAGNISKPGTEIDMHKIQAVGW